MKITYIYALREPKDGSIFYVGKSDKPARRYRGHFKQERSLSNRALYKRVHSMLDRGETPLTTILEVCSSESWRERERWWIAYFRGINIALENIAGGGDGPNVGYRGPFKDSAVRAERIRKAWGEWWNSLTPEQKSKQQTRPCSEATKKKLSEARKGVPQPKHHRDAVIASKGTTEFHRKASLSQKKFWASVSPEKKAEIIAKRNVSSSKTWQTIGGDRRSRRLSGLVATTTDGNKQSRRAASFWSSLSPENKSEFCEKRRLKQIEAYAARREAVWV